MMDIVGAEEAAEDNDNVWVLGTFRLSHMAAVLCISVSLFTAHLRSPSLFMIK